MKGNAAVYRPLTEIVDEALLDNGYGIHWKERAMRFAIKYAEELFQDGWVPAFLTKEVDIKPWKAIELPEDCVDWVAVGIRNGHDVMTFVKDRTIALYHDKVDGAKQANSNPNYLDDFVTDMELSDSVAPFINYTSNLSPLGENPGRLFGLLVKDNGLGYVTENVNKDVSELQFKFNVVAGTKIYLTYETSGFSPEGETMIHPYYAEYIVEGILFKIARASRNKGDLQVASNELNRQYIRMLDKKWQWSTEDITEYLKSAYGTYPKK